jgi:hypothetical protein
MVKSNQIQPSILRIDPFDPPHSSLSFLNKLRGSSRSPGGVQGLPNRQNMDGENWGSSLEMLVQNVPLQIPRTFLGDPTKGII